MTDPTTPAHPAAADAPPNLDRASPGEGEPGIQPEAEVMPAAGSASCAEASPGTPRVRAEVPEDLLHSSTLDSVPGEVWADLVLTEDPRADVACRDYGERYEYAGILGEGGQGIVVQARDTLLERDVAIKALKLPLDPSREKYLEREAKLCGILEHPNILPTYDLAHDETGSPLMVMKRLEGRTLEDLLREMHETANAPGSARYRREREMSRLRLLQLFLQVCHAIEFAHARKVLHLDIKPSNVKLGSFGEVYVIDWGFAAFFDEVPKHIAGTPVYIAPERFERRIPDVRCDVYSLGVMLYRILTNRHPRDVQNMTFREYRQRYREIPVIPPRQRDPSIPPALEAIVLKAMADHPDVRYRNVRELAEDLDRFLDLLPVRAYAEGPIARSWRFLRKHRRMSILAAVGLCLLSVTGIALWERTTSERQRIELQHRAEQETEARRLQNKRRAEARQLLERAVDLVEKSRGLVEAKRDLPERRRALEPALALFDQVVEVDPTYADAFYERGKAYRLAHAMQEAVADFEQAFALDSSYMMAKYYAGLLYQNNFKEPDRARSAFQEIQDIFPDNEYAMLGKAYVDLEEAHQLQRTGENGEVMPRIIELYDRTLQLCDQVEAVNPALSDIWFLRGLVYQRSPSHRNLHNAQIAYDQYLAARRDNPTAFHNRGDARKDVGDFEGAVADYTEALAVNPRYVNALKNRGHLLYAHLDRPAEGLADLNRALELAPEDFWSYMGRGAIYEGTGRFAEAEADYRRAFDIDSERHFIWYRLGTFYLVQGRLEEAERHYSESIRRSPETDQAIQLYRRGIVRLARGAYADAVSDFEASIRLRTAGHVYPQLMRFLAFRFQDWPMDPDAFGRSLHAPEDAPWLAAVGSHYLGEASEADVLRMAGDPFVDADGGGVTPYIGTSDQLARLAEVEDLRAVCEARFYLGAFAMTEGRLQEARQHFHAAVDTGIVLYTEHALARAFLAQIQNMPDSGGESSDIPKE